MSPFDGWVGARETASVPAISKRYTKPEPLMAAMEAWARRTLSEYGEGTIARIKELMRGIPGTDRSQEKRARGAHVALRDAVAEIMKIGAEANTNTGYASLVRYLAVRYQSLSREPLLNEPEKFPGVGKASRGWNRLTQVIIEIGQPWRAPERREGWRLGKGGRWRRDKDHELTLDELVAFAVLAGCFARTEAIRAIGQAQRQKTREQGATVADARDVLRKAIRERLKSLTRERVLNST